MNAKSIRNTLSGLTLIVVTALTACENNSGSSGDGGGGSKSFFISPGAVNLAAFEDVVVLSLTGGTAPFTWTVSEPALGMITGVDANGQTANRTVNYRRVGMDEGVNTVTVRDEGGSSATATIVTGNDAALTISPTVATLGSNDVSQAFTVMGGVPPYTWSAANAALGTISFADGTMASYTRVAGAAGNNTVTVRDQQGLRTDATVMQLN